MQLQRAIHADVLAMLAVDRRSIIKGPKLLAVDRAGFVHRAVPWWAW